MSFPPVNIDNIEKTSGYQFLNSTFLNDSFISLNTHLLSKLMTHCSLVSSAIKMPVEDAIRNGFTIKSKEINEYEEIYHIIKKNELIESMKDAIIQARLYGGCFITISDNQEPNQPLKINSTKQIKLKILPRFLFASSITAFDEEGIAPNQALSINDLFQANNKIYCNAREVHKSRLILVQSGHQLLYPLNSQLNYWDASILEKVVKPLASWLQTLDVLYEGMKKSNIDHLTIKDFDLYQGGLESASRLDQIINNFVKNRNYKSVIVGEEGTDLQRLSLNLSNYDNVATIFRQSLCQAYNIPECKLFPFAVSGMNSSNEETYQNYAQSLQSEIIPQANKILTQLVKLYLQIEGIELDDIEIEFNSPEYTKDKEKDDRKNSDLNKIFGLYDRGIISSEYVGDLANQLEILPIKLDESKINKYPTPPIQRANQFDGDIEI